MKWDDGTKRVVYKNEIKMLSSDSDAGLYLRMEFSFIYDSKYNHCLLYTSDAADD